MTEHLLERIVSALERIATALEGKQPATATRAQETVVIGDDDWHEKIWLPCYELLEAKCRPFGRAAGSLMMWRFMRSIGLKPLRKTDQTISLETWMRKINSFDPITYDWSKLVRPNTKMLASIERAIEKVKSERASLNEST